MGQKTNPIALRLSYTNRTFNSSWYSNYFYGDLLSQDLSLQGYVNEFLKCIKLPRARTSVQFVPKAIHLYPFVCFPKRSRELRSRLTGVPTLSRHMKRKPSRGTYTMRPRTWKALQASGLLWSSYWNHLYSGCNIVLKRHERLSSEKTSTMSWALPHVQGGTHQKIRSMAQSARVSDTMNPLRHMGINMILGHYVKVPSATPWWHPTDQQVSSVLTGFLTHLYSGCAIRTSGLESVSREFSPFLMSQTPKNVLLSDYTSSSSIHDEKTLHLVSSKLPSDRIPVAWKKHPVDMQGIWHHTSQFVTSLYDDHQKHSYPRVDWNSTQNMLVPTLDALLNTVEHRHKYRNLVQRYLSRFYEIPIHMWNIGIRHEWQGAGFLADEIVALLQQRIPFRRIKYRLYKECTQYQHIEGIRIQCAGRVGGKSKKAQRAKVESMTWGQTSLHVFSSRIDFASRTAQTALGSTGVKVWICYK